MSTRFPDAESEMFAVVHDWAKNYASVTLGYVLPVRWPGKEGDAPDDTKHWARVSTQTVISRKVGFVADGVGGRDRNKFEIAGLIFIQLFAPKEPGAYEDSKLIGDGLVSLLRKHKSKESLSFKNVRPVPLDPEPKYYRLNVVSETEYEQLD